MKQLNLNTALLAIVLSLTGYFGQRVSSKVDKLNDQVVEMVTTQKFSNERLGKLEMNVDTLTMQTTRLDSEVERIKQRVVLTR